MCDNFLCKWGFGLTHDTTCQIFSKYFIKDKNCKTKQKKKIHSAKNAKQNENPPCKRKWKREMQWQNTQ